MTVKVNDTILRSDDYVTEQNPLISLPAINGSGSFVPFFVSSVDDFGNSVQSECIKHSQPIHNGTVNFPLATTTVGCIATDGPYYTVINFTVNVRDFDRPIIKTKNIPVKISKWSDAFVRYFNNVTATDNVDSHVNLTCVPPSNSIFSLGNTTVTCTAKDMANNISTKAFNVTLYENTQSTSPVNTRVTSDTYILTKYGHSYPIKYRIVGGKLSDIISQKDNVTLQINILSAVDGRLIVELPRSVLDSKKQDNVDDTFLVSEDSQYTYYNEIKSNDSRVRTLAIPFDNGTREIKIVATPPSTGSPNPGNQTKSPTPPSTGSPNPGNQTKSPTPPSTGTVPLFRSVVFRMTPSYYAADIYCNHTKMQNIQNEHIYLNGTRLNCSFKVNPEYTFITWSISNQGSRSNNVTLVVSKDTILDARFGIINDFWSQGLLPTFGVSKLPFVKFLISVLVPIILLSILVGAGLGIFKLYRDHIKTTRKIIFDDYINQINELSKLKDGDKEQYLEKINEMEEKISRNYERGRITEEQYEALYSKLICRRAT